MASVTASPGTITNDTAYAGVAWSNPSNAASSNNTYAVTAGMDGEGTETEDNSNYLKAVNFSFSIPSGASIDGIEVSVERKASGVSAGSPVRDEIVKLVKAGTVQSTNKADLATSWTTSDSTITYGGAADLWGTTWTESDIEDAGFGVVFAVESSGASTRTASVDHIQITVHYTEGGGGGGETYDEVGSGGAVAGGTAKVGSGQLRSAGSADNQTGLGTIAWSNTTNILTSNNTYATVSGDTGEQSNYLRAYNFGFTIPTDARIDGIILYIEHKASGANTIEDENVRLLKGGIIHGAGKQSSDDWPVGDTVRAYGDVDDLWESFETEWLYSDINGTHFGSYLAVEFLADGATASVDHIQIFVSYANYDHQLTASGGAVCGGSADVDSTEDFNETASGGAECGGLALSVILKNILTSGGVVCGGAAIDAHDISEDTYDETATGGATANSTAFVSHIKPIIATGGATASGTALNQLSANVMGDDGATLGGAAKKHYVSNLADDYIVYDSFWDDTALPLEEHTADSGHEWDTVTFRIGSAISETSGAFAIVDTEFADYTISVILQSITGNAGGLVFRYVNSVNYWLAKVEDEQDCIRVIEVSGGVETQKGFVLCDSSTPGTLQVFAKDAQLIVTYNGSEVAVTMATFLEETKVGLWAALANAEFDLFTATVPIHNIIPFGGSRAGGTASLFATVNPGTAGGVIVSGHALNGDEDVFDESATGGALAGGTSLISIFNRITAVGGARVGGNLDVSGGATVGGSADIFTNHDTSGAASLSLFLTGTTPAESLGGTRQARFNRLGVLEADAIPNVVVDEASGESPATGGLSVVAGDRVVYASLDSVMGDSVALPLGAPQIVTDASGNWIRATRTTTDELRGLGSLEFQPVLNSLFGDAEVGGDTKYRALMLANFGTEEITNLKLWLLPLGTTTVCSSALSSSGAGTLSGDFTDWPYSGVVRIDSAGGEPREVVYFESRTNEEISVTARGLMQTSPTAGVIGDKLTPIPCCRIAKESPVSNAIQEILDESTAPTGVSWSNAYQEVNGITAGSLAVNQHLGLWFQRSLPTEAIATPELELNFGLSFTIGETSYTESIRSLMRVSDESVEQYETHIGVGEEPDLEASPDEVFTSFPHEFTYSFDPDTTYHLITNKRSKYNLVSQLQTSTIVALVDGEQVQPPPSPPEATIKATGSGSFIVTAFYFYTLDSEAKRGDKFRLYLSFNGSDPLSAEPVDVSAENIGGALYIEYETSVQSIPSTARAVVRTLRSAIEDPETPESESTNTNEITATSVALALGTPRLRGHARQRAEYTSED